MRWISMLLLVLMSTVATAQDTLVSRVNELSTDSDDFGTTLDLAWKGGTDTGTVLLTSYDNNYPSRGTRIIRAPIIVNGSGTGVKVQWGAHNVISVVPAKIGGLAKFHSIVRMGVSANPGASGNDIYEFNRFPPQGVEITPIEAVNSPQWDSHPFVASTGAIMFFTSRRPGGHGGADIWYSLFDKVNARWGEPVNAGPSINTVYDEVSPMIAPDHQTLYFSSNRPCGAGGFDVYAIQSDVNLLGLSRNELLGGNCRWKIALPVPRINTRYDELFYTAVDSALGLFSSNRPQNIQDATCDMDIYVVTPNPLPPGPYVYRRYRMVNCVDGTPVVCPIQVSNSNLSVQPATIYPDADGTFSIQFPQDGIYYLDPTCLNFFGIEKVVDKHSTPSGEVEILTMTPVDILCGGPDLLPILFGFDSAVVKPEFFEPLRRTALKIQEFFALAERSGNRTARVILHGHTDCNNTPPYNERLSWNRANAVLAFLMQSIDSRYQRRISIVAHGERDLKHRIGDRFCEDAVPFHPVEPLTFREIEDRHEANRRVVMELVP